MFLRKETEERGNYLLLDDSKLFTFVVLVYWSL